MRGARAPVGWRRGDRLGWAAVVSVLRSLEGKIEGLVQGAFSRAFRSRVQPVELARKLAKEMDQHKTVSISRTYVPNHYGVYLSPDDRETFSSYESALTKELSDYLLEHARDEGLSLLTRPSVEFHTDERLTLGEFGIQAQLLDHAHGDVAEPAQGDLGHTMVYSPNQEVRSIDQPRRADRALLVGAGTRRVLDGDGVVLGRSRECDIVIDDPNVSRRHAEVRREGPAWVAVDLGSTNGIKVNGTRVERAQLGPGDVLELGVTRLAFELE